MDRALARLEEGLTDQWGEAPAKVVREAQEIELPEFLTESRVASLWGPGQLLVLRRVELNAAALQAVNDYLDHPAPRAWVVLLAEGAKARDLAKNPVWGSAAKGRSGPGVLPSEGGGAFSVAESGGQRPGEDPGPGRGPAPGGDRGGQPGGVEPGVGKAGPLCRRGKDPDPQPGQPAGHPQPFLQHLRPGGGPGGTFDPSSASRPWGNCWTWGRRSPRFW